MWRSRTTWLLLGLVGGLLTGLNVASLWLRVPVHATATDGAGSFAIATGPVNDEIEAIFFLDFLTGDLKAAVLNMQTRKFMALFTYNVARDLVAPETKNPRYLMVTGKSEFPRGGGSTFLASTVVYVAELTSGRVAAYGLPWNPAAHASRAPQNASFIPLDLWQCRTTLVRPE